MWITAKQAWLQYEPIRSFLINVIKIAGCIVIMLTAAVLRGLLQTFMNQEDSLTRWACRQKGMLFRYSCFLSIGVWVLAAILYVSELAWAEIKAIPAIQAIPRSEYPVQHISLKRKSCVEGKMIRESKEVQLESCVWITFRDARSHETVRRQFRIRHPVITRGRPLLKMRKTPEDLGEAFPKGYYDGVLYLPKNHPFFSLE